MTTRTFDSYWSSLEEEVAEIADRPARVADLPLRSTEHSTGYGVTLESTGGFRVFAYYSVPNGEGPFPGLFMAPGYGSVVHVPPYERRRHYAVLTLCARGQRLSDEKYAAAYPGLLTDSIDDPDAYPFRGVVADCLRGIDFLIGRDEVDSSRLAASGGDLAFITAALRPQASAALIDSPVLFRDSSNRFESTSEYPLEEVNDYLRAHPERAEAVRDTLRLFDPLGFAGRVEGRMLVTCSEGDRAIVKPLVDAVGEGAELRIKTGRGYIDHTAEEEWLRAAVGA